MSITMVDVRTYRPISGVDDVTEALVLERRHDRAGYGANLALAELGQHPLHVHPKLLSF